MVQTHGTLSKTTVNILGESPTRYDKCLWTKNLLYIKLSLVWISFCVLKE